MERVDRKSCSSENRPLDRIFAFSQGTVLVLRALFGIGRKERERERERKGREASNLQGGLQLLILVLSRDH